MTQPNRINVLMILGSNWLEYEAAIAVDSFKQFNPSIPLYLAQPVASKLWPHPPRSTRVAEFEGLGAQVIDFENRHFGVRYPIGNKIEALFALPKGEAFAFFDTDTVFTGALDLGRLDLSRPMASLKRSDTWPNLRKTSAQRGDIWRAVYTAAHLDPKDIENPNCDIHAFERYPYFNAGALYGPCPHKLAQLWLATARAIETSDDPLIRAQSLNPWLDQVSLGPTIAALDGGQDEAGAQYLDHEASCHYRRLSFAYAREDDRVIAQIEASAQRTGHITHGHDAVRPLLHEGIGQEIRRAFYPRPRGEDEATLRKALKSQGYWLR
ncbi:MAG: hypothetical protein ABF310_08045 [Paracoccaceae bacterium]